jgi:hypothetical protein
MGQEGNEKLDQAYAGLEQETPDRVTRVIRWLRDPNSKWVRLPLGFLLVAGGFFGFLPVLGIEFIPVGLLLIAQDVPFLRKPVGKFTLWLESQWVKVKKWWQTKRKRGF